MLHVTFTPFPKLTTERLQLRQLTIYDDQEIFTLRSDGEINKYLDRQRSQTIDDARGFINKVNENTNKGDAFYWGITLGGKDKLVGTICLFGFSNENHTCEIGYELLTGFQGQGIMKEALEKVIDYAYHTLKVEKMEACVHKDNQSSIRLLEKFSFRNSNQPDQANPDLLSYCLTNSIVDPAGK